MFDFKDKVVIVTGGVGALGSAVVRKFSKAGAMVIAIDRIPDALETLKQELPAISTRQIDLLDASSIQSNIDEISKEFGKIDCLVNIAGGFTMGPKTHETDLGALQFMFDLNVKTMWLTSKYVLQKMLDQNFGRIVNIGARAGLEGGAKKAPYTASKSAVIRLTEGMAREYKENNINVNCILPGTIDTPQNRKDMPNANTDMWVPPEELADVIQFLCSPYSKAITGAAIPVYGKGL